MMGGDPRYGMMACSSHQHHMIPPQQPMPRISIRIPRVVPDQRNKFENDELFRSLSRECRIRYTGFQNQSSQDRQIRFENGCRDEGCTEIVFVETGTNLHLSFKNRSSDHEKGADFHREPGKVHIKSNMIMNGVCVQFRGWIDLVRLDGYGCLEFDEHRAAQEDAIRRNQMEQHQRSTSTNFFSNFFRFN